MANAWFVVAPVGASQGTAVNPHIPANSKIVEVATNSAAYAAWLGNGSYHGWQVVMGPFNSEAEAKKAAPPAGLSYLSVLVGASAATAVSQLSGQPQTGSQVEQNVKNGGSLGGVFSWVAGITGISGHNLLIRGLKIIIGGTLLIAGIVKLTGADKAALGVVGQVAGKLPGV